jgi:hypothetical protein
MAFENIVGAKVERRWLIAFGFGLVHGFGFSFALRETLQFAGAHLLASLVSFNVGVELGQLLVLAALIPLLHLLFRYGIAERMGTIVLSVIVGHTAWHWMTDRWTTLRAFDGTAPASISLLTVVRIALVILTTLAIVWLARWTAARRRAAERALEQSRGARTA